ncbi:MSMEG_0565 family glycosyltransferase [Ideonella sp. YS5]|uniref:MSMEG_0565 family glycosyltransferase n=1 Tax=Ideonella sp. YS5 TaxID=3453714 RepID=UPI003EE944D4
MTRLALLTHSVLPRGGVVHTLALADALVERGHAVTVLAPVQPGQSLFRQTRAATVLLPMATPSGPLVEQVRQRIGALVDALPAALAAGRFELLHAQDSLNGNALAELSTRGVVSAPWVRTVHHLDDFDAPELGVWQARGWQASHAVGCVSDLWQRHFEQVLRRPAERLLNGVDLQRFTPRGHRPDAAGDYVLALGGVEARKNTPRLLDAFAALRRDDPHARTLRLVVAGGASLLDHRGALSEWHETLARCGLSEGPGSTVERLGPIDDARVPELLRGARAVAMPSLVEGFGLVALEALACGTPVLVSERPPFTEHLRGCAQVAWCDPLDVGSIARGLADAIRIPHVEEPPEVCRRHDWRRSATRHEAWYAQVLAAHRIPA